MCHGQSNSLFCECDNAKTCSNQSDEERYIFFFTDIRGADKRDHTQKIFDLIANIS